jgi:flagella basal body P-ring formation protein FlgA
MKFWLLAVSCLPLSLTSAGVERFIQPMALSFQGNDQIRLKKSAFFSDSQSVNPVLSSSQAKDFISLDRTILEDRLSELLKHRYQVEGKVRVFLAREWSPLKVSGNFKIKIRDCNPDQLCANSYSRFSVWDRGGKLGDFSMPLRITHIQGVLFSKVPLQRGSLPRMGNFEIREVDVLKNHANSVPASAKLSGFQIDTNLKPGNPLKWNLLSKTTLIQKGEVVNVFASGNGIYVTMKGVALEDGVRDSMVRIKNISSQKEFRAKVLDANSVKVYL